MMKEKQEGFADRLKKETWEIHQQTDKLVFQKLKASDHSLALSFSRWYSKLAQSGLLLSPLVQSIIDLKFEETRSLLPSTEFTAVDIEGLSDHQLLGAYYVVRGSANGSRFIVEKLEDRHPLFPYFNQMAALSLENWKTFKSELNHVDSSHQNEVIEGALLCFDWLREEID